MYKDAKYSRTPEYYEELRRRDRNKLIFTAAAILVLAGVIVGVVFGVFVSPFVVTGTSMYPTLINGERVFVQKAFYSLSPGDIAVFKAPNDKSRVIKRVIAKPGDTVRAEKGFNGALYVNDKVVSYDYFRYNGNLNIEDVNIKLKDDEYFMLGDNYKESYDSRFYGAVKKSDIIGICITKVEDKR